jgi:hypothetical protein
MDDKCPICNGTGIVQKPIKEPNGDGTYSTVYVDALCECQ